MIIYIPKYKILRANDDVMGLRPRFKGEYRAILRRSDGSIKYDSGWQPNTILDQGFSFMCGSLTSLFRGGMALGDSDIAVDVTQTGLQGTLLGASNWASSSTANVSAINGGAPNYESINTKSYTYDAGNSTGTVKEFVFVAKQFNDSPGGNPALDGTIRVVLTAPIVKGPSDVLTIEHRTTYYPDLNDITGVIDISGVAYNYLLRGINVDGFTDRPSKVTWHSWAQRSGSIDDLTDIFGIGPTVDGSDYASGSNSYSPGLPNPYGQGNIFAGVNVWNKNIRTLKLYDEGFISSYQIRIGKVSDDSPLEKLNTHEFTIGIRQYPSRYVP